MDSILKFYHPEILYYHTSFACTFIADCSLRQHHQHQSSSSVQWLFILDLNQVSLCLLRILSHSLFRAKVSSLWGLLKKKKKGALRLIPGRAFSKGTFMLLTLCLRGCIANGEHGLCKWSKHQSGDVSEAVWGDEGVITTPSGYMWLTLTSLTSLRAV